MWQVLASVFLGWSLGANDASHVFGTAVASHMVRYRTAVILCAVFVVLGALLEGQEGVATYARLSPMTPNLAFVVAIGAGAAITLMSVLGMPVSSSQAVVGGLVLIGLLNQRLDTGSLIKVVSCWVGTPIGAALVTIFLYFTVGKFLNWLQPNMFFYDRSLRVLLIVAGAYGSYALGANNVANVTGMFVGGGMLTPFEATALGSAAIAFGVLTYGKKVMMTVGKHLVRLDAFTAFVAALGAAATVHIYAVVGVPVSTGQAIVGAVLGIGLLKGMRTINLKTLGRILFAWLGTPLVSAAFAFLLYGVFLALGLT